MRHLNIKFSLSMLLCLTVIHVPAYAIDCRRFQIKPQINFSTSYGRLRYDFEHNTQQITAMSKNTPWVEHGMYISGLAPIKIGREYRIISEVKSFGRTEYCIYPKEIYVYVGYSNPEIYVSNEFPQGSCRFNQILRHEQTHQQIFKTVLDYFIPVFKRGAEKIANEISPINARGKQNLEKANKQITNDFTARFDKLFDLFNREIAIEQGKLDNLINYKAESEICKASPTMKR